jgi:Ca2+/Na+ antiporter
MPALDVSISRSAMVFALLQMILGTVSIFIAGNILVDQSIYFAGLLGISPSLVGLLLLSIGTNVPEIVIALRAVVQKQQGIAFGGYLGSTATNTVTFALVALLGGPFLLTSTNFFITSILLMIGFILFYLFARSSDSISRKEGFILLGIYVLFVLVQAVTAAGVVFF